jgi:hypothetical protein
MTDLQQAVERLEAWMLWFESGAVAVDMPAAPTPADLKFLLSALSKQQARIEEMGEALTKEDGEGHSYSASCFASDGSTIDARLHLYGGLADRVFRLLREPQQ